MILALQIQNPKLLTPKNGQKGVFDSQYLFYCIFKNTDQKNICMSIVFKAESNPKNEEESSF